MGSEHYDTQAKLQAVVSKYKAAGFPLETVYLDVASMDMFQDFTVNSTAFPDMSDFASDLHWDNQKLIANLDAGFSIQGPPYNKYLQEAMDKDLLIKSTVNPYDFKGNAINSVLGQKTAFPDFF
jgi:alpha-glucosidase (family GH31 glycosyl hydrolase)